MAAARPASSQSCPHPAFAGFQLIQSTPIPLRRFRNALRDIFHMDSICPCALAKVAGMMNSNQMELGLKAKQARQRAREKQRRQQRAQWWFAQMRRVVDGALEWKPEKAEG